MAVRSEQSRRAILEATMDLLGDARSDALTVRDLSIERIAREAGVSKTTIYRWWPSKTALIIDTFLDNHIARTAVCNDLPAIDALREHMVSLAEIYSGHEGRLIAQLVGECQFQAEAMAEFKERFWFQRRDAVADLIDRCVAEGSLRDDLDPAEIVEILYAPIYFRLLWSEGALDRATTEHRLTFALDGLRTAN